MHERAAGAPAVPPGALRPAEHAQERYIAQLAREISDGPFGADCEALLREAGVDLTVRPRLAGVVAASLSHPTATGLISKLLRLAALSRAAGA